MKERNRSICIAFSTRYRSKNKPFQTAGKSPNSKDNRSSHRGGSEGSCMPVQLPTCVGCYQLPIAPPTKKKTKQPEQSSSTNGDLIQLTSPSSTAAPITSLCLTVSDGH